MLIKLIVSLYTEIVTSSLPAVFSTSTIQYNTQFSTSILHTTTTIATLPTQLYIVTSTADIGSSDPPTQLYTVTSTADIGSSDPPTQLYIVTSTADIGSSDPPTQLYTVTSTTDIGSPTNIDSSSIVGGVLGSILVLVLIVIVVSFLIIKRIKRSNNAHLLLTETSSIRDIYHYSTDNEFEQ